MKGGKDALSSYPSLPPSQVGETTGIAQHDKPRVLSSAPSNAPSCSTIHASTPAPLPPTPLSTAVASISLPDDTLSDDKLYDDDSAASYTAILCTPSSAPGVPLRPPYLPRFTDDVSDDEAYTDFLETLYWWCMSNDDDDEEA